MTSLKYQVYPCGWHPFLASVGMGHQQHISIWKPAILAWDAVLFFAQRRGPYFVFHSSTIHTLYSHFGQSGCLALLANRKGKGFAQRRRRKAGRWAGEAAGTGCLHGGFSSASYLRLAPSHRDWLSGFPKAGAGVVSR